MRKTIFELLSVVIAIGAIHAVAEAQFLGPQQVNQLPSTLADYRIQYGSDPLQFGDLRLPKTSERPPVAVVIHGGCWKARVGNLIADLQNTAALSSALTSVGRGILRGILGTQY